MVYFRRDSAGVVRLSARQSSQSSTWLLYGEGYPVFTSPPMGRPEPAALASDAHWDRQHVQVNVRRWLPDLVTGERLTKAEAEWATLFASIPPNGSLDSLPAAKRLAWTDLPRTAHLRARAAVVSTAHDPLSHGGRDLIKNPVVDPLLPHSRRDNQRRKELDAAQDIMRIQAAEDGDVPPVFALTSSLLSWIGQRS
jgi:hypothetical protein